MLKRFLILVGILLFLVIGIVGVRTLLDRHNNKTLIPTVTKDTQTAKNTPPAFNKKAHRINDPSSIWVVVNKTRPLSPLNYAPGDLVPVGNNQQMRSEAATALADLITGAKNEGLIIQADSGYRSYAYQISVYDKEVQNNGQAVADSESARPGFSEHQTGFAVDVGGGGCNIDNCFADTAEGKWVAANAYKYGFIVRYTAEKQSITGYRAEPWHIRYIGTDLSNEMRKQGVTTLEEFFGLQSAPDYAK